MIRAVWPTTLNGCTMKWGTPEALCRHSQHEVRLTEWPHMLTLFMTNASRRQIWLKGQFNLKELQVTFLEYSWNEKPSVCLYWKLYLWRGPAQNAVLVVFTAALAPQWLYVKTVVETWNCKCWPSLKIRPNVLRCCDSLDLELRFL